MFKIPASPWSELAASATIILGALAITMIVADGRFTGMDVSDAGILPTPDLTLFWQILGRNGSVALGLFTGAVTLGVGTVIFSLLVGSMLGWSMAMSIALLGPAETFFRAWSYTPLELAGFVLAGAAGLSPLARSLRHDASAQFSRSLPPALHLLVLALVVLAVAAGVEVLAIANSTA